MSRQWVLLALVSACGGAVEHEIQLVPERKALTVGVPGVVLGRFAEGVFSDPREDLKRAELKLEGPLQDEATAAPVVGRWKQAHSMMGERDAIVGAGVQDSHRIAAFVQVPAGSAPGFYRLHVALNGDDGVMRRGSMLLEVRSAPRPFDSGSGGGKTPPSGGVTGGAAQTE